MARRLAHRLSERSRFAASQQQSRNSARQAAHRAGFKPKPQGFTPYAAPTSPPPGTYDPTLDANLRASQRGYGDLTLDTERDDQRATTGLETGRARIGQDKGFRLADLLRGKTRETQDYGDAVTGLKRGFQQQGSNQAQAATAAGVTGGGTLRAALAARQANEAIERKPLDTGHARAGEDYATNVDRTNVMADRSLEDLGTNYQYGFDDRHTGLDRAGRELGFFTQDTGAQKFFQAAEAGRYVLPGKGEAGGMPSNEGSDAQGPYRVIMRNGRKVKLRPNGSVG